ncbi:MAG: hypothetical protein ACOCUT_00075 [bacterium]
MLSILIKLMAIKQIEGFEIKCYGANLGIAVYGKSKSELRDNKAINDIERKFCIVFNGMKNSELEKAIIENPNGDGFIRFMTIRPKHSS